jgi:solute carrier family 35 protein E1
MSQALYIDSLSFNSHHSSYKMSNLQSIQNFVFSALELFNLKLISLCFIWYLTSVISSSTTKQILKDFKYPVSLTEIQFIINAFLCLFLIFSIKLTKKFFNLNIHKKFPDGTFPPLLIDSNYSIIKNFLLPSYLILKTTIPMGIFQFLGQIASHNSTSIIPVSLVHTIKALSPLTTVLIYRFLLKKQFQTKTYLTLIPLITGVMLCCTRNNNLNIPTYSFIKGSLFAFLSMLIFVSQNIFAKKILTWDSSNSNDESESENNNTITNDINNYNNDDDDSRAKAFLNRFNWNITRAESAISTPILPISISSSSLSSKIGSTNNNNNNNNNNNELNKKRSSYFNFSSNTLNEIYRNEKYHLNDNKKLDKLSVLFYCSIVGFILTLPFYLISEFRNLKDPLKSSFSLSNLDNNIINLIIIYGLSHFIQSLTAFQILGMVSPVNYSIANILKRIIIISCSIIIEGITLNFQQWLGLSLTFIGLYCYDKWGVQRT